MIERAIIFATKAHKGQLRKVSQTPFILHPLAVGCMLADTGESEAVVVAGILHDTVEDTDVTLEQIRQKFGTEVADIVDGCSENKTLSWYERKTATIELLETASLAVCAVTCADKIHNLLVSVEGIKKEGKEFFIPFKKGYTDQKWYYGSIVEVLQRRMPDHPLLQDYEQVFAESFGTLE